MRNSSHWFAGLILVASTIPAQATITLLHDWRLGDGGTAGGLGAASANDSVGGYALGRIGAPTYSADVPPGIGSALSMAFNGTADQYQNASGVASTLTDNFGLEVWAKWNAGTPGSVSIAYNGNSSTSGWGIYQLGTKYGFLYGGVVLQAVTPVANQWTDLALVRNSGTTTFYVNGVAAYTTNSAPNPPTGGIGFAGNSLVSGAELFNGKIDQVRIFSFAPGQFSVSDLNLPQPQPAPLLSWRAIVALGLGLLALAGFGLRRKFARASISA